MLEPIAPRRRPPPPPPRNDLPPRDTLLAAVRERAPSLKSCALPDGALARLPLRLHVASSGAMRSVECDLRHRRATRPKSTNLPIEFWPTTGYLSKPFDTDVLLKVIAGLYETD